MKMKRLVRVDRWR